MAISIRVTPGETNRFDLKKVERKLQEEKQVRLLPEQSSWEDNVHLPKGLSGVVAKYNKIAKKASRSTRDEYDLNDDFIDDSEAVEFGFEDCIKEELQQDFYVCSEELEEPLTEEGLEPSSVREETNSLEDSFSEHSQIPTSSQYTYEELYGKLEPIPEAVKSCVVNLKKALESNNLPRRWFTSTHVASYIKDLVVIGAQHNLAQRASFGENGAVRCSLTELLWSHIKAVFSCKGLSKYRCTKRNFEYFAFYLFHREWKQMLRNEMERLLSDLKHELRPARDLQFEQGPMHYSEDMTDQAQNSQFSVNSSNIDPVETQTQGSEGAEEDISASPTRRRKRKAATMAAEEISNLAVHGSTQSPSKKKKPRIEWSEAIDKLVYHYFVKKLAQIRCRDSGKSKKNEVTESASELLNAAFLEYDVTERDLIDSYRRHKAEIQRSQKQKSKEKREEIKRRKELAAQKKWEREQSRNKSKREQQQIFSTTESKECKPLDSPIQSNVVTDTAQSKIPKLCATSSGKSNSMDTFSYTQCSKATSMDYSGMNSSTDGVVRERVSNSKVHNAKHILKPKCALNYVETCDDALQLNKDKYQKWNPSTKSLKKQRLDGAPKNGNGAGSLLLQSSGCEISQSSKSKPKKPRPRSSATDLNEKILKKLASIGKTPPVGQRRIPEGFAEEVEAAVE
ncbi:hypothetical protein GpartN1_g3064.t1 [Galdieria partita]|uniref:Hpc2-related domain-containing protein n=1 Tax=Galdieria partita TaxID=83374 RepID=A0A9C7UPW2_9RHOD|nr:hypothetical protein GpartN1_g3064.t1 [Galdieria partita]